MAVRPSKGSCTFAMAMQIERGSFGGVSLDGIPFVVVVYTPEEMGKGNWSVGLVVDERASTDQREAITAIARRDSAWAERMMKQMLAEQTDAATAGRVEERRRFDA